MSTKVTRRQVLAGGIGALGVLAAGSLRPAGAAASANAPPVVPDRSKNAPAPPVAIQRCESYEPRLVRERLDAALALLGGIGDLVRGKTVTVKLNLTGIGDPMRGIPASRTYQVHPNVVAALCAVLADAGAKHIYLVEGFYFRYELEDGLKPLGWDVDAIQAAGGRRVEFENTRNRGHFSSYANLKVPWGGYVYPAFHFNARYEKTDVFMSLAKLKDHYCAGVTGTVKNLFGAAPQALYGDGAPDEDSIRARIATFHNGECRPPAGVPRDYDLTLPAGRAPWRFRVPRIVADCLGARPVDLAILDGVETITGGEGPWIDGVEIAAPKLLIVGRNAVCTDSVTAGVQGYNPNADHLKYPFQGENHLRLLAQAGVGSNDLARIEVRGVSIDKAKFPFHAPTDAAATACGHRHVYEHMVRTV